MSRLVLTVIGALWVVFGVVCLVAPSGMLAMAGIDLTSAQSMAEIRAMYGGAQIGFGVFLLLGARRPGLGRAALLALALVMGGFAFGRLCGIALDGTLDTMTLVSFVIEVALLSVAIFTLSRERSALVGQTV